MRRLASPATIKSAIVKADVDKKGVVSLIPWWRKSSILVVVADGDWLLLGRVVSTVGSALKLPSRSCLFRAVATWRCTDNMCPIRNAGIAWGGTI